MFEELGQPQLPSDAGIDTPRCAYVFIIPDEVAIGDCFDANNEEVVKGFSSILCLTTSGAPSQSCRDLVKDFRQVQLVDGPGNDYDDFERAVRLLQELTTTSAPVLVHCFAGRSRSVSVVAAWLAEKRGISVADALEEIRKVRDIDPKEAMVALAEEYVARRRAEGSVNREQTISAVGRAFVDSKVLFHPMDPEGI